MDELLFAITERFNPLCTGQTLMMNRGRIPQTDGLKCKPCLNIDFTTSCCCNCFRVESVGAFLSDVVTGCSSANFVPGNMPSGVELRDYDLLIGTPCQLQEQCIWYYTGDEPEHTSGLTLLVTRGVDGMMVGELTVTFHIDEDNYITANYACPGFTCNGGQFVFSNQAKFGDCGPITATWPSPITVSRIDC